jgi:hypothetical protein
MLAAARETTMHSLLLRLLIGVVFVGGCALAVLGVGLLQLQLISSHQPAIAIVGRDAVGLVLLCVGCVFVGDALLFVGGRKFND